MSDQNAISYQSSFFIVPSRILNLPGLTMAFLRFYETIFQFWNHEKKCYLSNQMIKDRTGISSSSTIQEAFEFFENHRELKRVQVDKRRYLIQPEIVIEVDNSPVDNSPESSTNNSQPLAVPRGASRPTEREPLAVPRHNNKNLNKKNINKNIGTENLVLPDWLDQKDWDDFKQHRKDIKKPMNEASEKRALSKLQKMKLGGQNVREIINESIINGWSGLFEINKKGNSGSFNKTEIYSTVPKWGPGHPGWHVVND